jgi:DNA-binding transcriptional ArsR family regulator
MKVEIAADRLEALGNPTRLQIYRLLVRAGWEGLPVGAVQERLRLPASTLSHHLRRLIEAELVTQERQATTLLCRANFQTMEAVLGYLFAECCAEAGCMPRQRGRRARQTA